jgi:hypothetical protein
MPLLLHNWREIMELWVAALDDSDDEGLRAVLECVFPYRSGVYDILNCLVQPASENYARPTDDTFARLPRPCSAALARAAVTFQDHFSTGPNRLAYHIRVPVQVPAHPSVL